MTNNTKDHLRLEDIYKFMTLHMYLGIAYVTMDSRVFIIYTFNADFTWEDYINTFSEFINVTDKKLD